eukprot:4428779-Pyramimonas_sp.AAC.1
MSTCEGWVSVGMSDDSMCSARQDITSLCAANTSGEFRALGWVSRLQAENATLVLKGRSQPWYFLSKGLYRAMFEG